MALKKHCIQFLHHTQTLDAKRKTNLQTNDANLLTSVSLEEISPKQKIRGSSDEGKGNILHNLRGHRGEASSSLR